MSTAQSAMSVTTKQTPTHDGRAHGYLLSLNGKQPLNLLLNLNPERSPMTDISIHDSNPRHSVAIAGVGLRRAMLRIPGINPLKGR